MTAPVGFIGLRHFRLAAIKTLYQSVPGYFVNGGAFFADPTKPTELPTVPTTFGGPYTVIPTNGSYLMEPPEDSAQQNPPPWICIESAQVYNRDRPDDDSGVLVEMSIAIRARVSAAHADAGGPVLAKYIAGMRAECLVQAALFALMRDLGATCRVLDPSHAFQYAAGGFVDNIAAREVLPQSEADGQNQTIFDAVGSTRFFARLYEQGRSA